MKHDMKVPNAEVLAKVGSILEATRDVFIHDHGAFTNECNPNCGWYIATKKDALDKAFTDAPVEGEVIGDEDGN